MKWEIIKAIEHGILNHYEMIARLDVPGGWLIKYIDVTGMNGHARQGIAYVPDDGKEWNILKEPIQWERIANYRGPNFTENTYRFAVPNGWIVVQGYYPAGKMHSHTSLVFVPDTEHRWQKEKPTVKEENNPLPREDAERISTGVITDPSRMSENDVGTIVAISGAVQDVKEMRTKKGESMAAVTLESPGGVCMFYFFPDNYRRYHDLLLHGNGALTIEGRVESIDEMVILTAMKAQSSIENEGVIFF